MNTITKSRADKVLQQIIDAEAGQQIIYYEGFLAEDAFVAGNARSVREGAWEAYEWKFAFLTQRRLPQTKGRLNPGFAYIATRSSLGF